MKYNRTFECYVSHYSNDYDSDKCSSDGLKLFQYQNFPTCAWVAADTFSHWELFLTGSCWKRFSKLFPFSL